MTFNTTTARVATKTLAAVLALAAFASVSAGCAIHQQAPIREVAYDFSDHQFYDRAYAPSPAYASAERQPTRFDASNRDTDHYGAARYAAALGSRVAGGGVSGPSGAAVVGRTAAAVQRVYRSHRPSLVEAGRAPLPHDGRRSSAR
ncbi:MAG TPA: hypothetical protein ENK23_08265 [Sorangium sp.]|nr:hypothetical protein [Sorangium sp.]